MSEAISVILLSYNRPHYIQQAINSVLWQTFKDFELIIVENSTDGGATRQVVDGYKTDPRVKVYYEDLTTEQRQNQCIISYLNNKYIDVAQGKYVFFFCDDDILFPNCLEEFYKFAEGRGGVDCHCGQLWLNFKDGIWSWQKELAWHGVVFNAQVSPSCKLTGGAVMFRKDHILEMGQPYFRQNDPKHCATADAVFFEDFAKRHPIYPVNQTLSIARFHSEHRSFEYWRH
jgi:glycosyltransferase involved in cell wall biosynthesis